MDQRANKPRVVRKRLDDAARQGLARVRRRSHKTHRAKCLTMCVVPLQAWTTAIAKAADLAEAAFGPDLPASRYQPGGGSKR